MKAQIKCMTIIKAREFILRPIRITDAQGYLECHQDEDSKAMDKSKIKVITDDIIYKLIENLTEFQEEKRNEIKRERLLGLASICKLTILPQFIFRNSNPAVFGVKVESGKLKHHIQLIDENDNEIAKVKDIQENQNKII